MERVILFSSEDVLSYLYDTGLHEELGTVGYANDVAAFITARK